MSDTEDFMMFCRLNNQTLLKKALNLVYWFNRLVITFKKSSVLLNNLLDEKCELNAKPYNFLPPYRKC